MGPWGRVKLEAEMGEREKLGDYWDRSSSFPPPKYQRPSDLVDPLGLEQVDLDMGLPWQRWESRELTPPAMTSPCYKTPWNLHSLQMAIHATAVSSLSN